MARFHKTLLLPGNEITAMMEHIEEGQIEDQPGDMVIGGPYEMQYDNGYSIRVWIVNSDPITIHAGVYDNAGHMVHHLDDCGGSLDQDYSFDCDADTYELTVVRAAHTVLVDAEVEVYLEQGGVRCPCCGSDDLHQGKVRTDASIAWCRVECCSCGARWKDQYSLTGISREADDFDPPTSNVARQTRG